MKFVEINLHRHCTSVHFSIQPTRTHSHSGQAGMRAVGRWSQNFQRSLGEQIHSLGQRTFQAVGSANCIICKQTSFGRLGGLLNYYVLYFLSVSGNLT